MSEFFETSYKNMFILALVPNTINSVVISKNHPTFSGDIILFMLFIKSNSYSHLSTNSV